MVVALSISFIVLASLEVIPLIRRVFACSAAISSSARSLFAVARCSFCFQSPDRSQSLGPSVTLKSTSQSQYPPRSSSSAILAASLIP